MKVLRLLIYINLIIICLQSKSIKAQENKSFMKGDFTLELSPSNLINPFIPTVDLGTSYFILDNLSIQFVFGKKVDLFNNQYRLEGQKFSFEYQYFIYKNIYLSMEHGGTKNKFSGHLSYYYVQNDQYFEYEDDYVVIEERLYTTPKIGYVLFINNKISFDCFAGLGFQKVISEVSELEYDQSLGHKAHRVPLFKDKYIEENDYYLKLSLGFSLIYKF